ncbi:DNA internalization-related competence protein ComEC/Rec2 [Zhongshania borealis]|uniref:DNA internalization-related competence protein ComEC/Rec2 n=1 Tax=Zhongshania borealis TaxID=889488 RepID=UPI0031E53E2E
MLSWMTTAILAITAVAFTPVLPTASTISTVLIVGLLLAVRSPVRWRWPLVAFLLAGAYAASYGLWRSAQLLPLALEGKDISLKFRVLTPPEQRGEYRPYYRFDADTDLKSLGRVRLNWYEEKPPVLGHVYQAQLRLKRPYGYRSPGAFDYGRWLFVSGYSATGYVRRSENLTKGEASNVFSAQISRYRLIAAPRAHLDRYPNGAIMKALLFADRSDISSAQWQLFQQTGTSHLMAISGMHIGMILLWGWGFGRVAVFFFPRALLLRPLTAMLFCVIYAAMAGFTVPTQRALVMAAIGLLAYGLRRHISVWQAYFLAMLVVLIVDPLAPHQIGFNLSFAAVGVLLWAFQGRRQRGGGGLLHSQWVVVIGLLPVLGMWGLGFSLASFPANLLAIPLVGLLILPSLFGGLLLLPIWPGMANSLFAVADSLLTCLQAALGIAGQWHAIIQFHPSVLAASLALVAVVILLLPRGIPAKWLAFVPLLAMFYCPVPRPAKGDLWATVLDVGQGVAVLIQTRNTSLLYDVGPDFSSGFNSADAVVLPALATYGIDRLDTLVLSHGDRDHAGAAPALIAKITPTQLFVGEPISRLSLIGKRCHQADSWTWDGIPFEFLSTSLPNSSGNNASCVLKVGEGAASILLTGDIEAEVERHLLESQASKLNSTVLLAPHHGSKTSSTREFIAAVSPSEVVFPAARLNSYGHPASSVLQRYERQGSRCWHTGLHGTIQYRFRRGELSEINYARARRYYWEEPAGFEICLKFKSEG